MGDETREATRPVTIEPALYRDIIDVLRTVYGGGYVNQKMTFDERRALRASAYRALKGLGIEK